MEICSLIFTFLFLVSWKSVHLPGNSALDVPQADFIKKGWKGDKDDCAKRVEEHEEIFF